MNNVPPAALPPIITNVAAVDARDPEKLLDVGGALDTACEGCHKQFCYPNQEQ